MKSKSTLSLIEQIIMVLVFAVVSAICLKVFMYSNDLSKEVEEKDNAYLMIQTAADMIKNTSGKIMKDGEYSYEQNGTVLTAKESENGDEYLGSAQITVCDSKGNVIAEMPVKWQRGGK